MPMNAPALPAAYEPVVLDRVDSVVAEAVRRAAKGAGEGTLIWAREQTDARTRSGKAWFAPSGNLHCALIIQPEYDNVSAQQLLYVAMISAGTAIADTLEAMTGLRWRWPDEIFINDLKSGMISLAAPAQSADPYPWLVIGVGVNVAEHPPNPEPERFNSIHASGTPEATVEALLEGFSRHFLSWINRWADEGFEPVRRAWSLRADGLGEPFALSSGGTRLSGILRGLNDRGEAEVELADGSVRALSVAEVFGFHDTGASRQTSGVYFAAEGGERKLVHTYTDGDYQLADLVDLFAVGTAQGEDVVVLTRDDLRPLKVRADAESFDHDEGLIEMCLDIYRFGLEREESSLRFISIE